MSDERESEQAGAPVEETEASATEVQAAVERAAEVETPAAKAVAESAETVSREATVVTNDAAETVVVAETATQAQTSVMPAAMTNPFPQTERPPIVPEYPLPSAGPAPATAVMAEQPLRDGEIRISADHPMAALYMQSPMPPTLRGNRGFGLLVALLATIGFALVYGGILALLLAPTTPPSRFAGELVDAMLAWSTVYAVVAFFIGFVILVLIVGRAGWWAYVLGGFLVGLLTWAGAIAGILVTVGGFDLLFHFRMDDIGLAAISPAAIAALIVAREATVWFGAWIGARGRRVTRSNAEAMAEYENALAEARAKQL